VTYEIALPPPLANIHNIFHVSQLRKYVSDPSHILESDSIQVKENLSFEVKPIKILDSQVKQLRGRSIPMVRVLWDLIFGDSTWEIEEVIRASYPNLFLLLSSKSLSLSTNFSPLPSLLISHFIPHLF